MHKKIGLVLIITIVSFISYGLIAQIISTLKSEDRLQQATENLQELQLENRKLERRLSEIKSPQFIEQQARDKLGLAREGETVVIIPDSKLDQVLGLTEKVPEVRLPNWLGWFRLFWH